MTIGEIFDRAVVAIVHRWKVAVLRTGASALVDIASRATSHTTNLWLGLILIGVVVDSYVFALQIRQFAPPASGPAEELTWRLTQYVRRSLPDPMHCLLRRRACRNLGDRRRGVPSVGIVVYRGCGRGERCRTAGAPHFDDRRCGRYHHPDERAAEGGFPLRLLSRPRRTSPVVGLGAATLVVALVPPLLIEYLLRFADIALGMNWLLLAQARC